MKYNIAAFTCLLSVTSISNGHGLHRASDIATVEGDRAGKLVRHRKQGNDAHADGRNTRDEEHLGRRETNLCTGYFCTHRFGDIKILMAHNSNAAWGETWSPNQYHAEPIQFEAGIRGFNMDIYEISGELVLKHNRADPFSVSYPQRVSEIVAVMDQPEYVHEFVIIKFQAEFETEQGIKDACAAWGDKVITDFDSSRVLGDYINDGKRVLIMADNAKEMPEIGMHKGSKLIVENNYKWENEDEPPDFRYRRGPKEGSGHARMMNYFCAPYGLGNPKTSAKVNRSARMLVHARQYMEQDYSGGILNIVKIDFYTEGTPFLALAALRDGDIGGSCSSDGSSCGPDTSCFNCCAGHSEYWQSKGSDACGIEPCSKYGESCWKWTSCNSCCSGANCPWYKFGYCNCY